MADSDNPTRRVIAVIALMILAAWALRGYLPGVDKSEDRAPVRETNPAALFAVVALLCAAVAVIGFAVVMRMRAGRPRRPAAGALPRGSVTVSRPTWRFAIVALAVLVAWLLLVMAVDRIIGPAPSQQPPPAPSAPSDTSPSPPTDVPPPPHDDPEPDTNVINYLIPPMLVLMTLIVVGTAVASRRQQRIPTEEAADDGPVVPPSPATATSLARAAEIGLVEIADLSREPREAIIACYAAMERELTRVPGAAPQDCDTPTEVLARAVDSGALRADSATGLVELFEEARFSPHVMSEAHRDAALQVLQRVLAELPQREAIA